MSKCFVREQDYEIDSGKYEQSNLIFICSERNSKQCIGSQSQYVHTCYSANNMFIAADRNAIVPMCQLCTEFLLESKVKKNCLKKLNFHQEL